MDPIFESTDEEKQEHAFLTNELPGTLIGLGAHSLFAVRSILAIVDPVRILEIGFDRGHSTAMWLGLSEADVTSVDISDHPDLRRAVDMLQKRHPDRLTMVCADSALTDLADAEFDLAFIDGDHSEEGAFNDLCWVKSLDVPWVALDDWLPQFGPGVQRAAERAGFKPLAVFKQNIALGRF